MSDIVTNTIDIHYPVAGVDNDSKGFRDNYARIQTALAQAKTELERFETHSVLKTPLSGTGTASNDLSEGTLFNGKYNKFYGTAYTGNITDTAVNISLWNGIFQKFVLAQDTTITFSHWPVSGSYGCLRLHLIAASSTAVTLTSIVTTGNGTVIQEAAFPSLEITNLEYQAIEAYTFDGGVTVFVNYLGRYVIPTV
jgi:hypothetical protein